MVSGMGLLSVGTAVGQTTTTGYNPGPPAGTDTGATTLACDPLVANANASCTISDPDLTAGLKRGTGSSTPFSLGEATGVAGSVRFSNFKLPADYEKNANHSITVVDVATGRVQASKTFGVSASGAITAPIPATGNNLPKTGTDYVDPALKAGGALLVAGGAIVLVARRRKVSADAAV